MLFKPRTVDEACVQAQYLENIGQKKGKPSGSSRKSTMKLPRREEEVERGKYKKTIDHYTSVQIS
jgi:hypothetical protein